MLETSSNTVRFIVIRNPLVPDERLHLEREYDASKTLYDYIGELQGSYAISHNGAIVEQHSLSEHTPHADDVIVICPVLHGSDGGKTIMRLVAVVALTAFTYGQAAWAMPTLFAGTTGLGAMQVAVAIGGTLLINAILPYEAPSLDTSDSNKRDLNYGIDGAKNSSEDNIPFPLVYGEHRVGGNIIGNYTEQEGQIQYLNLLICAGEGVIAGIDESSIHINDQPIDQLTYTPEIKVYRGHEQQVMPTKFGSQKTPIAITISPELKDESDDGWTEYTTSVEREIEGFIANFSAQIVKIDKSGKDREHFVPIEIQYAPYGTTDWHFMDTGVRRDDFDNNALYFYTESGSMERFDPTGKTVTRVPKGTQFLKRDLTIEDGYGSEDGDAVNFYIEDRNLYAIHFEEFTDDNGDPAIRRIVEPYTTINGETTKYKSEVINNTEDTSTGYGDRRNYSSYEKTLDDYEDINEFEYGDLEVDGVVVGTYHDFHRYNTLKPGVNDSGLIGGLISSRFTLLRGDTSSTNLRYSYESPSLPLGRYVVRAKRYTAPSEDNLIQDQVFFNELIEIVESEVNYINTALLQMRLRVTDQINNIPTVTFVHRGQIIRTWHEETHAWIPSVRDEEATYRPFVWFDFTPDTTDAVARGVWVGDPLYDEEKQTYKTEAGNTFPQPLAFDRPAHILRRYSAAYDENGYFQHSNPAWIALDLLTHPRYGAGLSVDRVDFYDFKEWAEFCEEKNLQFHGVFSDRSNVWDVLAVVFKVGRGVPVRSGTRYGVSMEKEKLPTMRFGQDNIVKDTFSTSWLSFDDRANEIELTFYDKKLDYKPRTIKVYDTAALERGAKSVNSATTIKGIVDEERAIREATFMLNYNKLVQMVTFTAPIESLACSIGDVVMVQHNMMDWGLAGKIADVTDLGDGSATITLDQEFTFDSGQDWQFVTSTNYVSVGRYAITNIYANYVTLEGFDASLSVKRMRFSSEEVTVLDTFTDGLGNGGVILEDASFFSVGHALELLDTDVIQQVSLTPSAYDTPTNSITVTGLSAVPEKYDGFLVGFENFEARPFTIRSIGLTGSAMTREITGLEYDARALSDDDTDFVIEDVVVERALAPVQDVEIYEKPYMEGYEERVEIKLHWTHSDARYRNAGVNIRITGEGDRYLGQHTGYVSFTVEPGRHIQIFITPFDQMGKEGVTKVVTHTAVGGTGNPFIPANVYVSSISGGAKVSWNSTDAYLRGTEVYAMESGTLIDDVAIDDWVIDDLTEEQVLAAAERLGITNQESFVHIIDTDTTDATNHFYWVRSIDAKARPSGLVYGGKSTPYTSVSYNTVTVYRWSDVDLTIDDAPTGGNYYDPTPNEAEWSLQVVALDPDAPSGTKLWQSTRRFANLESKSDPAWSLPSYISNPSENNFTYTWIAYADDLIGTNLSFAKLSTSRYIGHAYNQTDPVPSTDYNDYDWVLLLTDPSDIANITESALADIFNLTQTTVEREFERTEMYGPEGINAGLIENETKLISETQARILLESTIFAKMDSDIGAILQQVSSATADLEGAWATLEERLMAQYRDTESYVSVQQVALANTNLALAQVEETLRAEFGSGFAEITEIKSALATAEGTYAAQWGVTTNVNGLQGGVGFYNNGTTTQFVVDADIFAVRDAGSTEVVFSVVDGQTVIKDAFIREAYIQNLIADHISANTIEANTIAVGATLTSVNIRGSGTAGFGAGGPYNDYHTFIDANGLIQTNNITATGGTFSNVLIDGTCEIDDLVISGSTYSLPKFHENTTAFTLSTGSHTMLNAFTNMGQVGSKAGLKFEAKVEGGQMTVAASESNASATIQVRVNGSTVISIPRELHTVTGSVCCRQNDGDCVSYCDTVASAYFETSWEDTIIIPAGVLVNGTNQIEVLFVFNNTSGNPIITSRKFETQMIEVI